MEVSAVQEFQKDLLQKLYDLREKFYEELKAQLSGEESDEVKKLQDQNRRLEYRILHLTEALKNLMEQRNKQQQ